MVDKRLVILAVGVTISLLLGGLNNVFLFSSNYVTTKSGFDYTVGAVPHWWNCNWSYVKKITIDYTKVQGDQENFPVLLYEASDADLAAHAQDSGYDLVFTDRYNLTQYSHELEKFDGDTGELWAWVRIPSLSSTQDTIVYLYYGNPSSGDQQHVAETWDANYMMVQHLDQSSGVFADSTSQGNDGTGYNGVTRGVVGKIDGAVSLDGVDDYIDAGTSSSLNITNQITLEGWVQDPPLCTETHSPTINEDNKIEIINAIHLDTNRHVLSDVYYETLLKDSLWSEPIYDGEYIRVTFERALNIDNDIIIVVRSQGTSQIEITLKDNDTCITTIKDIVGEQRYQIFLTNLSGEYTTFDLRTSGDGVEYNYIVDPTGWVSPTGFADPSSQWSTETKVYDDNTATYAENTGAAGWRGFLELTLSSPIYCDRVRVFSDFGYGFVDRVDVDIYNSSSWIDKYNGTISDAAWTILTFSAETSVTKARFRYHYLVGGYNFWLYEFDFWQGQIITLPTGTTFDPISIDETTAILQGNVTNDGGEPCQFRFQYGSNTSYGNNTAWTGSKITNEDFTTMIHNLTLGHTYQYRVQVSNSVGTANGTNKNFTTAIPALGWVTPTSHYDPNSKWDNEVNVYDNDTETYARSYHNTNDPNGQWSLYIYVNHSVLLCDKVRFFAKGLTGDTVTVDQVDLDLKRGGVWADVFQGSFSDKQWVEKNFVQGSVVSARLRFHLNSNTAGTYFELYEFDFNKSRAVPTINNPGPTNSSWGVTLRPQMNITANNPDGASMNINWYSNSSGSWQLFGTNSSVSNGTYHQRNTNFSSNNTKYWWKVIITDGTDTNTSWFYFSTPDSIKPSSSVDAIAPYWKTTSPLTITATASDTGWSGLKNVTLYYRFSSNNASWDGWKSAGVDTASPWSWSFTFSNGTGYYQFYSIANDNASNVELAPGSADARCGYDTTAPSSSVDAITPYWKTAAAAITATASDATSGVKNVTLYYRFSSTNASWGGWVSGGVDTASPWSWSFSFSNGTGYYQFYSIARDNATKVESAPGSADALCGYDNLAPSSTVDTMTPYWKTGAAVITATASDTTSGVKNVTLYYRFSGNNASWGSYVSSGVDVVSPWSWSFIFTNGTGYYQFYSIAKDNATNTESAPGSADTRCGYDNAAPTSSVNAISPYWWVSSPQTLTGTTSDTGPSGLKNVTLWYRYRATNTSTWGVWVSSGLVDTDPWVAVSWSFTFPNGTGNYQFYSIARDNATNTESAPGSADASCGYDNIVPSSAVDAISLYWKVSSPQTLTGTASDTLCERYNTGDDGGYGGGGTVWKCQTFTVGNTGSNVNHYIGSVKLKLNRVGTPGTITVGIRATNATGYPTGSDLTYGTIDGNTITTDNQGLWYQINFTTPYLLSQSTKYAIIVRAPSCPGGSFFIWRFDSTGPTYSGGSYINGQNSGTTWSINLGLDLMFEEHSVQLSGLKNVTLWFRYRATNSSGWGGLVNSGLVDTDPWIAISWSFTFPNGTGHYQFYSIARDNATNTESAPGSADASCGYDNVAPTSSVDSISPYWKNAAATITATASDSPSDVKNVTLWYRFSSDNNSWGRWVSAGVDTASPWSWSFSFSNGTGYYQFYSIAKDNAANAESAPRSADAWCGYETGTPTSTVDAISPYWKKIPTTLTATASDAVSGVKNVTLWYRFSTDNISWGGWVSFTVDTASPWSWSFTFPNSTGYYQFYSIAKDYASNAESAPGSADARCACDNEKPSSSVNTISPYMVYSSPLILNTTASDSVTAVQNVTLWYRYSTDNSTWGTGWYNTNWMYRKKLTIDHTKVAATLTNFPVLVSITDANLSVKAQSTGNDILFTNSTGTKLPHEIESYTSATGALVAWVNVASVSSTADTVLYVYYGNPSASDQQNKIGTWDGNYQAVWHLDESANPYHDSTNHKVNSTGGTYPTQTTGQIGKAQTFVSASSQFINFSNGAVSYPMNMGTNDWTVSAWIKTGSDVECIISKGSGVPGPMDNWQMRITSHLTGIVFMMTKQNVGSLNTAQDGTVVGDNVWHYVTVRIVRNDKIYRYVDGSVTGTNLSCVALNGQNINSSQAGIIGGRDLPGNANFFNGVIDEVRISKVARSAAWITTEYNNQKNPNTFLNTGTEEPWRKWSDASNPDTSSPWSWNFNFPNGTGYYQFYSIANDTVGNKEDGPSIADAHCHYIYDVTKPSSSITTISSPYWKTTSPLTVSATASDSGGSGLKNVTLYFYNSSNNATWYGPWDFGAVTNPWAGISWSFTFPKGAGYYRFYSIAVDNASNTEVFSGNDTRCAYDSVAPTSSVDAVSPYWKTVSSLTITASSSDTSSGVKNVTLWYRFSSNNGSWGGWVSSGLDTTSPWSWSFSFSNATGFYQFYSIAKDNATNTESAPGNADASCGYDTTAPTSSANAISPYWKNAATTITATASDATSGVKNVTLYYRFSSNNGSWGGWVSTGVDTASPWSWSFSFSNGTGYYQFYSIAKDNATIVESAPGSSDAMCGYENLAPTSSVNVISSYWKSSSPLALTGTASDIGPSGLKNVTLWYRYRAINTSSWEGWVNSGLVDTDPWVTVSWSFSFPNETGHYQFYSIARDNATNTESVPGSADASCGYYNFAPSSSVNDILVYWKSSSPLALTGTASDIGPSGLKNVTLWFRYRATNSSGWGGWVSSGLVDTDPWVAVSWSFTFPNGTGHYQFYSIARDNATNTESPPGGLTNFDTNCGYDNIAPVSSVNTITPYLHDNSPITISANASDPLSGVKNVTLYYRYSANNASWNGYITAGTDTARPWSWSFAFTNGSGYYQLYSIAKDNATNTESAPGTADARCRYLPLVVPTVVTNTSTGVKITNATLHGFLQNDGGEACTVRFLYGPTETYGTNTTNQIKITGATFQQNASGLTPGQYYHYKAYANNTIYTTTGADLTFLTKPNPPASLTSQTNSSTKIYLTWTKGTGANTTRIQRKTGGYPTSITDGTNVYNQSATQMEDTGLTPSTTYYYRAWSYTPWDSLHQWSETYTSTTTTTKYTPILSNESPTNGSTGLTLNTTLSIQISNHNGYPMTITWYWGTNTTPTAFIGTNTSASNGTYTTSNDGNFSSNSQTYYWRITVSDGHSEWTNATYHFSTIAPNKKIISKGRNAYALEINPQGTTLTGYINNQSLTTSIDTNWHYVSLTYDGTHIRLYKDGILQAITNTSGSITTTTNPVLLGESLSGNLDEIRLSTTARTQDWLNTTYHNTNQPTTFATFSTETGSLTQWHYRKTITINHTQVKSTLTNFPVLINLPTDNNLRDHAQNTGYDILFTNDTVDWTTGTWRQQLNYELESYDPTTGALTAWINIPNLSSTTDTIVYMYYNCSICTNNHSNPTGVWNDNHYAGIWHMNDLTTSSISDSTNNHNNGTKTGAAHPTQTTGKINNAQSFDGTHDSITIPATGTLNPNMFTLEYWVKPQTHNNTGLLRMTAKTDNSFETAINSTDDTSIWFYDGTWYDTNVDLPTNTWTQLTWTYDATTLTLFKNGKSVYNLGAQTFSLTGDLYIGMAANHTAYLHGTIDELRLSNLAQNNDWINTSYRTMNNPSTFITLGNEQRRNHPPAQSTPSPTAGATDVPINPTLSIKVNDQNADTMDVTFRTNATGTWTTLGTNTSVTNGTYRQMSTTMNNLSTTYYWSVNATDGETWTNVTYSFTTTTSLTLDATPDDGWLKNTSAVYNTAQTATNGTADTTNTTLTIGQDSSYRVARGFLFFNTSNIPDSATISSVTLRFYGASDSSNQDFAILVYSGQPAHPHHPLVAGDFDADNYTANASTGTLNTSTFSTSGYNTLSISPGQINKTGFTKLLLWSSRDQTMMQPQSGVDEYIMIYSSEQGAGYIPELVVVYS